MNPKTIIRNIQPGEDGAIWRVAKTLGIFERYIFYYLGYKIHKTEALVAVDNGRIIGCVVPRVFTIAGEKIGTVDAIFVDRNFQGKGVGKALMDAVMIRFQKAECQTLCYIVDRFNSPSWNMALQHGFDLFELNEQIKIFGWKIISLWWAAGYFFSPGLFMLIKKDKENQVAKEAVEGWHFLLAWLGFSFVLWIGSVNRGAPWFNSLPFVLGVVGVSIFTHELSHKIIARFFGFKTIFKVWESGLIFSLFWVALGSALFPFYGSTFIKKKDWIYSKHYKKMGLVYMAGPLVSLILASSFLALSYWANTEWLVVTGIVGFWANFFIILFNLIPIFPFACFDGSKIFLWNKIVWLLLIVWFILLLSVKIFS